MSPDFEYFLRARLTSTISHTLSGIVLFCLPVGFLVYVSTQLFRPGVVALMPSYLRARFRLTGTNPSLVIVALSLVIGATTHVVWDSFTHKNGWSAQQMHLDRIFIGKLPFYTVLQHGSTLVGLIVVAAFATRFIRSCEPAPVLNNAGTLRRVFWPTVVAVPLIVFAAFVLRHVSVGTSLVRAIDTQIIITLAFATGAVPPSWRRANSG